jgi:hypothetical protein
MKAYLTFYKKNIGFLNMDLTCEREIEEIPSGCPILIIVENEKISCVYRIGTNGELNQIYGFLDRLIEIEVINDLSYKYLKIYQYIRFLFENIFRELTLEELISNKTILIYIEKTINDQFFNNALNWDVLKSIVSKEIKNQKLDNRIKSKLTNKLNKLREPNAYVTSKKIDVNIFGYDAKIIKA